jgi:excisionase family DNA binding protein
MLSVPEVCRQTSLGRSSIYKEIQAERLKVVKVGRRTLIPASELSAWAERLNIGGKP